MTWVPSPELSSLVSRLLGRRRDTLGIALRAGRDAVAEDFASRGRSGGPVVARTTAVCCEAFSNYAAGCTEDLVDLVVDSGNEIERGAADWIREQLGRNFDGTANGLAKDLAGLASMPGMPDGAKVAIARRVSDEVNAALISVKRDMGIALDKVVLRNPGKATAGATIDQALLDVLVHLKNRRAFDEELSALCGSAEPFGLVWFDIDRFKQVNDDHGGHATGDEALCEVAARAERVVRGKGSAYRCGGDEFALLLPNHTVQETIAVAERFRVVVNSTPVTSRALTVSVSVGVASFPEHGAEADALKKAADDAAYDAKKLGRNLVRVFGEAPPDVPSFREPLRRTPVPGTLTEEQKNEIRLHVLRHGWAACPHDEAKLDVTDVTAMGEVTKKLHVSCPFCGWTEQVG